MVDNIFFFSSFLLASNQQLKLINFLFSFLIFVTSRENEKRVREREKKKKRKIPIHKFEIMISFILKLRRERDTHHLCDGSICSRHQIDDD